MADIRDRIDRRDPGWVQTVWDPILLEHHGVTVNEAGEQGMEVDVADYRIPWAQHVQISGWASRQRQFPMAWLNYGPGSFGEKDDGDG